LRESKIVKNETEPKTIADGARTLSLGNLNWEIIKDGVTGIFEVPDEAIADALRLYFGLANLKSEPTGALSLGAIIANKAQFENKRVCLVVSGGNVDPAVYSSILND